MVGGELRLERNRSNLHRCTQIFLYTCTVLQIPIQTFNLNFSSLPPPHFLTLFANHSPNKKTAATWNRVAERGYTENFPSFLCGFVIFLRLLHHDKVFAHNKTSVFRKSHTTKRNYLNKNYPDLMDRNDKKRKTISRTMKIETEIENSTRVHQNWLCNDTKEYHLHSVVCTTYERSTAQQHI